MNVVVLAWGNEARGDDGIGPALAAHVEAHWPAAALVVDDQLQIEHALDLKDRSLALFIDAGHGTPAPYRFYETSARSGLTHTSHALPPESVLDVARQIGVSAPPSFVLCIPGERWGLGESLSEAAEERLELARALIDRLLGEPDAESWRSLAGS
ncbi:MAG: hydrogenase maturation protease [Bradyrhizobium sp.]|uniref:hydrogenase maturation protease n=1 Tax=Bradyrhizobium sp. TaxID=376 RepID=UPI0025C6DEEF|nr:hydrogenase maturation protease [Bradyrhizobium sp.]MBI5263625.1 hydrogenase maturation protease [Bradyrhizobium sp.]